VRPTPGWVRLTPGGTVYGPAYRVARHGEWRHVGAGSPGLRGGTSPRAAGLSVTPDELMARLSGLRRAQIGGKRRALLPAGLRLRPGQPGAEQCAPAQHRPTAGPTPRPRLRLPGCWAWRPRLADSRHVSRGHLEQNVAAAGIKLYEHTGGTASGNTVTACTCRPAAEPPTCGKCGRLVVGPWPWLQGPVDVPSVFDPQDDHLVEVVADPVEDPVSAASGGPYTSQVVT
jgi:hypothetical protein